MKLARRSRSTELDSPTLCDLCLPQIIAYALHTIRKAKEGVKFNLDLNHCTDDATATSATSSLCYICKAVRDIRKSGYYAVSGSSPGYVPYSSNYEGFSYHCVPRDFFRTQFAESYSVSGNYDPRPTWDRYESHPVSIDIVAADVPWKEATSYKARRLVQRNETFPKSIPWQIKEWTELCTSKHTRCQGGSQVPQLPTRVVDVGDGQIPPRLLITRGKYEKFAALSHCWGGQLSCKTTRANLAQHCHDLSHEALPRTFNEAILITRLAGLQYVWIDALCIIQDSPEDWAFESTQMENIYHHATVVFAALDGRDSTHGLDLGPSQLNAVKIPFSRKQRRIKSRIAKRYSTKTDSSISCDESNSLVDIPTTADWVQLRKRNFASLKTSSLRSRAWTLQEELLARRIVYFTGDTDTHVGQLIWGCLEKEWSEDGLCQAAKPSDFERPQSPWRTIDFGSENIDCSSRFDVWYTMYEEYSTRSLTRTSDKLRALQGIGDAFHKYATDAGKFLYSLWENDLRRGLRWRACSYDIQTLDTMAPSWAPTSLHCRVLWVVVGGNDGAALAGSSANFRRGYHRFGKLHDADFTPLPGHAPVAICPSVPSDWHLTLRGNLAPITKFEAENHTDLDTKSPIIFCGHGRDEHPLAFIQERDFGSIDTCYVLHDASRYVRIGSWSAHGDGGVVDEQWTSGIVLKKIPPDDELYMRVGWCESIWGTGDYLPGPLPDIAWETRTITLI